MAAGSRVCNGFALTGRQSTVCIQYQVHGATLDCRLHCDWRQRLHDEQWEGISGLSSRNIFRKVQQARLIATFNFD